MNVKPKLLIKPEFGADVCLNCFISTIKDKKTPSTLVIIRPCLNQKTIQIINVTLMLTHSFSPSYKNK